MAQSNNNKKSSVETNLDESDKTAWNDFTESYMEYLKTVQEHQDSLENYIFTIQKQFYKDEVKAAQQIIKGYDKLLDELRNAS